MLTTELELELELATKPELTADLLAELWRNWCIHSYRWNHGAFEDQIAETYDFEELTWCSSCDTPGLDGDDWTHTADDGPVCTSCETWYCDGCGEYYRSMTRTISGCEYCDSCSEDASYCEDCDESYIYGEEDHDHDHGCDCEAPAQSFTVRNDGEAPLANDTRVTIALPAGVIDGTGLRRVREMLRANQIYVPDLGDTVGPEWQTRRGNFPKRVSRYVYEKDGTKLSPEILSTIGVIAREHSTTTSENAIEVTRNLNLPAGEFYHEDSCWWGGAHYGRSRCALKSNGGFGLRTFNGRYNVSGRAWVMPLTYDGESFAPTFDTVTPDAFVVFNGYGDLSGYTPARIVAHMAGMTYRKVEFDASPMYINCGGYLVAPEAVANEVKSISMYLDDHAYYRGIS